jgi:putative MATE family efflux protein
LTNGSLLRHLLKTTSFMLVSMVFQTLYVLIDLYWVGSLGTDAVAAVAVSGNLMFVVLAATQMLGVGTTALVSHAVGGKDRERAVLVFNQSQVLSTVVGLLFFAAAMALRTQYAQRLSADVETARQAEGYLLWFIPAMSLQFGLIAMSAALRGTGNFKPGMYVSTGSVAVNMVLAPFLMFGWGPFPRMGVAGAAAASLVAIIFAIAWFATFFIKKDSVLHIDFGQWRPQLATWKRMLAIGLPAGFEFGMMAVYLIMVYSVIRPFGASAQAGFGIGQRVIQAGFMPVVALGFAVAPVGGQNFGAGLSDRVKATFKDAVLLSVGMMVLLVIITHVAPAAMVRVFSKDPAVIAVGVEYLKIISWNFIASGVIFVASSMFQAMGNTIPSLISSGVRILVIAIPLWFMSRMPGFQLHWIWFLAMGAVFVQLLLSLSLLRREFRRRLPSVEPAAVAA